MTDHEKRLRFRELLKNPEGCVAPGVADPLFARLAADCGYAAVHLSGNAIHKSFCLVDENILSISEMAERAAQIDAAVDLPLIVDGGPAVKSSEILARMVHQLERAGVAAIRLEDSSEAFGSGNVTSAADIMDRIKIALDARNDSRLAIIARCDSRPVEPLDRVLERLAVYAEAGADAVGVQLTDAEEFRKTGASVKAPLVSLWPKTLMTVSDFLKLGFRIALMPSSIPLAGLSAAREMLVELRETGTDRGYFKRQKEFATIDAWYKNIGRR